MKAEAMTEVLIAGAGPSGLLAACELKRRGINCRIIDKNPTRSQHSKALAIHAPTLEIIDLLGLAGEFTGRGNPVTCVNLSFEGSPPLLVELAGLDTRFPYILSLPQSDTEEILENHLSKLGLEVERNVELTDFEQFEDRVEVSLRHADGSVQKLQARYLIDCEGAHSPVRHKLGLPFKGKAYEFTAFLSDVKLEGMPVHTGRINIFTSQGGGLFVLALPDGYWRVIAIDFAKQHPANANDELSLDEIQDSVNALSPAKLILKEPRWLTRFGSPYRIAPSFRVNRVFLAGDAAHVHSPAGGQGMNMGLQDAFNLAWKLALVLRGQAPAGLLDSYNQERHTVDAGIMQMTDFLLRNFLLRNAFLKRLRRYLVEPLAGLKPLQKFMSQNLTGLRFDYRFNQKGGQQAGMRVNDLELFRKGQPSVRLYDFLRESETYILFGYLSASAAQAELDRFTGLLQEVKTASGGVIQPCLVLDETNLALDSGPIPVMVDFKKQFRQKLEARHGSLLLVRPDAFLAFHQQGFDRERLGQALKNWVCLEYYEKSIH